MSIRPLLLLCVLVCGLFSPVEGQTQNKAKELSIAVIDTDNPQFSRKFITDSLAVIKKAIFPDPLKIHFVHYTDLEKLAGSGEIDLFIGSSSLGRRLSDLGATSLVSVSTSYAKNPSYSEGSLVIKKADRPDIKSINSLKGKVISSGPKGSFSVNSIVMGEVAKYGFSPESFFKNIIYHNVELHKIVEDVEKGTADVGIMRLCAYEKAIEQGRIDPRKIVPAFTLEGEQTRCLHSTDLYPNWTLFAFPTITAQLASKITAALITMAPGNNHAEWVVPGEFNQLDNFLKRMNLGQFKELRSHYIKTFISKNLPWFLAGCALFILILSYSGILRYLVEKRTSQLKNSLKRQKSYFEKIIESEQKIQILQRRSAAGQLSNLISHELKQPLTTILCSAEVIDKKLDAFSDVDVSKDLDLITSEAIRATSIIDRVRDVAKGTKQPKEVVDFSALIKDTVEQYQRVTHGKADVQFNLVPGVFVRIVPIDWQLLILNLLKNAQENGFGCKNVLIVIKLIRKNESVCVLSIENSGNLSDQELDTINSLEPKSSTQGLGIGLVIVRDIAISSDALLKFSKSRLGGLCVSLELNYEIRKSHTDSPSCG